LKVDRLLTWAIPALALLMLAVILLPADIWRAPRNDAIYHGFDSNLMYASGGSTGHVEMSTTSVDITAPPIAQPSVNLVTTLLPNFSSAVAVNVLENKAADQPFRIGVWSPWTGSGRFVVFGPSPDNTISIETIDHGGASAALIGGQVVDSIVIGHYRLGSPSQIAFIVNRTANRIDTTVTQEDGTKAEATMNSSQSPALFGNVQMSLTGSAMAGQGTSHVVLQNFTVTLPHHRWWATKVDDPLERIVVIGLALLGLIALGLAIISHPSFTRSLAAVAIQRAALSSRARALAVGAVAAYFAGNALLFPLGGGHPFDFRLEEMYAYVARSYGLDQLYFLPNAVSLARFWGGIPYIEASFPYGPVFGYLYAAVGWLTSVLFAGGGTFTLASAQLPYILKTVNVFFGLGDAALIYAILRQLRANTRWALIAAALFLFNPAVWFSMSVWGQTHVISLFFVLVMVWFAEKRMAVWAWLALAAALMTRPQMIVFGLLLGIVLARKFPISQNVWAISRAVIVVFLLLLPFSLSISPSLPVDVTLNNFRIQQAGGNEERLATVSQDAYSVWPLVTYVLHGTTGSGRAFTPSSAHVVGDLTYQRLGLVLTIVALLAVSAALAFRRRVDIESGGYLPLVALGISSFLMLLTGVVATHFVLALPFLLLCRRWMGSVAYFYVAAIWTVATFVPMYGDMGIVISASDYPLLAQTHNAVTKFVVELYSWDRFITVSIVANICAVIWLAVLALRRSQPARFVTTEAVSTQPRR
jgi:hypothetical protein